LDTIGGISTGIFRYPWYVAVDGLGNVYVSDTWHHCVKIFHDSLFVLPETPFGTTIVAVFVAAAAFAVIKQHKAKRP
jgi:hypothetical protein